VFVISGVTILKLPSVTCLQHKPTVQYSPPKRPSTSLFDDFFIWQTRYRDSKQNIKIPNHALF